MRLAVFASGGGSNFQAILNAETQADFPVRSVVLITNSAASGAIRRAEQAGVPSAILDPTAFDDAQAYTQRLMEVLRQHAVDFIALAGYLRKVPDAVVRAYHHRILNIHPALLPGFGGKGMYGARVHRAVLEHGVRWTGATVHLVDEEYDTGPIVLQHPVPVHQDDTPETLAARVFPVEHRLYPEALRLFGEGRVRIEGRRVRIDGAEPALLIQPVL